jgi:hypothetical protein
MHRQLGGVFAKLDRADEHLESLETEVARFLYGNPYEVVGELNREESAWYFILRIHRAPPVRISTIIGDIAHNLRSALDHLVWQLVLASGGNPREQNAFPICLYRDTWRKAAPRRLAGLRSPTAVAEIQRLQPYLRRHASGAPVRHPLAVLNRISNIDKHRLMLPAIGALEGLGSEGWYAANQDVGDITDTLVLPLPGSTLKDKTPLVRVSLAGPLGDQPEVKMYGLKPFRVILGKGGLPPEEALGNIAAFIREDVLPRFERFIPSPAES